MAIKSIEWIVCCLAAVASVASVAFAEDAELLEYELPPFKVDLFRFGSEVESVPAQVNVIGPWDLQASGAVHLSQVLGREPGVSLQSFTGGWGTAELKIRGFGGNSGLRVLVLLDGVKLNRPDMRPFHWGQVPMMLLERVEILEGSYSALYGNHAVGGVIRLHTRPIALDPETHVRATIGSYGLYQGSVLQTIPINKSISAWIGVDRYRESGYRANAASAGDSGFARVELQPTDALKVRVWSTLSQVDQEYPGPLTRDQFEADPRMSALPGQSSAQRFGSLQAKIVHRERGEVESSVGIGLSRDRQRWDLAGIFGDNTGDHVNIAPQVIIRSNAGTGTIGIDLVRDTLDFTRFATAARETTLGSARLARESAAIYAFHEVTFRDSWSISGGARFESARLRARIVEWEPFGDPGASPLSDTSETMSNDGIAINVGVVWKPAAGHRLWARYDRLYRYPVVDEVAAYQGYPLPDAFNRDLGPERGHNFEIGGMLAFEEITFSGSLFRQDMVGEIDFIATDAQGPTASRMNRNLPPVRRDGLTLGMEWTPPAWRVRIDGTMIDARYRDGQYSGKRRYLVPRCEAQLQVEWLPSDRWRVGGSIRAVGSAPVGDDFSNSEDPLPGARVVDFQVTWNLRPDCRIVFGVDNAFDAQYASVAYRGDWYPAPGRTASIQFAYRF